MLASSLGVTLRQLVTGGLRARVVAKLILGRIEDRGNLYNVGVHGTRSKIGSGATDQARKGGSAVRLGA